MTKPVLFDINEAEWKVWEEGVRSAVFKPCKTVTMQYWEIDYGTGAKPHSHACEQLVYIQQGVVDFTVGGVTYNMTPRLFLPCTLWRGALKHNKEHEHRCQYRYLPARAR